MNERFDGPPQLRSLSDEELISLLRGMDPLPDVDDLDPAWTEATLGRAEDLVRIADAIGERRLTAAIAPLYGLAPLGDAFGLMLGLRHGPERSVEPHYARLTEILIPLAQHPRGGSRRWAINELGILRDPLAAGPLIDALSDPLPIVREEACRGLGMSLGIYEPSTRRRAIESLTHVALDDVAEPVRRSAARVLERSKQPGQESELESDP